jgi:uncharacterized protein (TIGR03437 family)
MNAFPSIIRTTARRLFLVALLLSIVSVGMLRSKEWNDYASAQTTVTVLNAASFANDANRALSPDTIAAAFGSFNTIENRGYNATSVPLPQSLGGVSVTVNGTPAGLFFAGTQQVNLLIPSNIADGDATIIVTNNDGSTRTGTFRVARAAPGLFTVRQNGTGTATALTTTNGAVFSPVYNPDGSEADVSAGTRQQPNILVMFGTGIRNTTTPVVVKIQGVTATVQFAGPVPDPNLVGLDQLNVVIPPEISGFGIVGVTVSTNNRVSNQATLKIGGQFTPVRVTDIAVDQQVPGSLTVDDQVQLDMSNGKTFFFDAYRFSVPAANTPIAIDLRSSQFDAYVILYRIDGDQLVPDPLAADDQSGGYGNGMIDNDNALLFTVVQNPGQYVAYASTSDVEPNGVGDYTLKITANVARQINYGQTISDAAITPTDLQTSAGTFLDLYWFVGAASETARITMTSTTLDSFVILQDNGGDPPIEFGDAGGVGNTAVIQEVLPNSGIYFIIATPFAPNITGGYSLSLTRPGSFTEAGFDSKSFRLPTRQIRDARGRALKPGEKTLDRARNRRVIER